MAQRGIYESANKSELKRKAYYTGGGAVGEVEIYLRVRERREQSDRSGVGQANE
jgi:hypothetical protein